MAVAGLSGQLFGQPENSAKYEPSRIFGNRGKVSLEKRGVGGEFHGAGVNLGGWRLHTGLKYQLRDAAHVPEGAAQGWARDAACSWLEVLVLKSRSIYRSVLKPPGPGGRKAVCNFS